MADNDEEEIMRKVIALSLKEQSADVHPGDLAHYAKDREQRAAVRASRASAGFVEALRRCQSLGEMLSAFPAASSASPREGGTFSELAFFLRFVWDAELAAGVAGSERKLPEHCSLFAGPRSSTLTRSEDDALRLIAENDPKYYDDRAAAEFRAWRWQMCSKLADMTACGHLADALLDGVLLGDAGVRAAAVRSASDAKKNRRAFAKLLRSAKSNYVVRVELSNVHVLLLDFPRGADHCYIIQSCVRSYDCEVRRTPVDRGFRHLDSWSALDRFDVFAYDAASVADRLVRAVRCCFDPERLAKPVEFFRAARPPSWDQLLDGATMVRHVHEEYPAIWSDAIQVFLWIAGVSDIPPVDR